MKDKRPININPLSIKLPITAFVSIGHRISGVVVFLLIPLLLYLLSQSLASEDSFQAVQQLLQPLWMKLLFWGLVAGFAFHLVAGIRHLLMDCHIGDSLRMGRLGAWLVIFLSTAAAVLTAWAIWCIGRDI